MYALTCTTPRLTNTGAKLRATDRVFGDSSARPNRRCFATDRVLGTWTRNCIAAPITDAHASVEARSVDDCFGPHMSRAPIIATFQSTGAENDSRNLRWVFRTPRHHAEITKIPAPGKRMRVKRIVSARRSPVNPGAINGMITGAATTPS